MSDKLNINENNIDSINIFEDAYKILDEYSKIKNELNEKNKQIELLKLEIKKNKDENEYLNKKYMREIEEKTRSNIQLKNIKNDLEEKEKKVLMLKTLLQIIIKNYGIEEVSKITKLNEKQLKDL